MPNAARRPREHLRADEVERLIAAAKSRNGRYGHRDATMILIAYRHGLRASELTSLRWDMLDLPQGRLHVSRLKNGRPSVHPLGGKELRTLRRLQREQAPPSPYLFTTEHHSPMTAAGFRKQLAVIGAAAAGTTGDGGVSMLLQYNYGRRLGRRIALITKREKRHSPLLLGVTLYDLPLPPPWAAV